MRLPDTVYGSWKDSEMEGDSRQFLRLHMDIERTVDFNETVTVGVYKLVETKKIRKATKIETV